MALYDPAQQGLLKFQDDRFGTISAKWRLSILLSVALLELALVVWIQYGDSHLLVTFFPTLSFSLINSGILVHAIHIMRVKRRSRYRDYLSALPPGLITLSAGKLDSLSQKEIIAWQDTQKVSL